MSRPTLNDMRDEQGALPAWAWPGGYPIVYYTLDGLTICPKCANKSDMNPEQAVDAGEVYWEGPALQCDDCSTMVESAYGEPNTEEEGENNEV